MSVVLYRVTVQKTMRPLIMLVCAVAAAAARPQLAATTHRSERWQRTRDRHAMHSKLVRERPLLRWAEWPFASPPDLPATYGEFLDKRRGQVGAAITLYVWSLDAAQVPRHPSD